MCDGALSGDERSAVVTEVPAEADVGAVQVLAGVVEGDGEGDCLVLDEALIVLVYIVDLRQGYPEWNLI